MKTLKVEFKNCRGQMLDARLELPENPKAFAIFVHCFTGSKDNAASRRISRGLANKGFATLRFDFTGLGGSDGDFSETNFTTNIEDTLRAAEFLEQNYEPPKLLIGHSLGGTAVLATAPQIPTLVSIATIGSPCDPMHVQHFFKNQKKKILEEGSAVIPVGPNSVTIQRQFILDLEDHHMKENVTKFKQGLMVIHSPQDDIVHISNARNIFMRAHHPKSFLSLEDADHMLTRKEDAEYVAQVLAAWAKRYINEDEKEKKIKEAV